jgi:peptidoglycan/xylan/chitin deacetylase (PgdA/CDA1 family)
VGSQVTGPDALRLSKRLIKLVISVAFWFCTCLSQCVARLLGKHIPGSCVVLYYHSIPVEHRQRFARQMDHLARLTRPIRIDTIPPLSSGLRYSAVTFDDAFENITDNALPELIKRSIPSALFVPVNFLGQLAEWWPVEARERQEKIITQEKLRQLPSDLIVIGSHTLTHPKLSRLDVAEAQRELSQSKVRLEEVLKRKVTIFSFPYGVFDGTLVSLCQSAGYERVFTTLPEMAFREPSEFVTGRVGVEPTDWALEFRLKLLGAYRWLPYAFSIKRMVLN